VKLRPKWSNPASGTCAWQTRVRLLLAALVVVNCSDLDPNIGKLNAGVTDTPDAGESDAATDGAVSDRYFAMYIRPLMDRPGKGDPTGKGCKGCHYGTEANHSGVDLSGFDCATLGKLRQGGGSSGRRIIVPGKPAESVLYQVLAGTYPYSNKMPKNGPYWDNNPNSPVQDITYVETWIRAGAKGADDE
jgi:hypothetical protein